MKIEIGELKVELDSGKEFRQIITYIESSYSAKCKEIGVNYTPDHVFNENLSVKWNRTQVEEKNSEKNSLRDKARLERINQYHKLYEYLKLYVEEYLELPNMSTTFIDNLRDYLRIAHDYDWPSDLDYLLELLLSFKQEIK